MRLFSPHLRVLVGTRAALLIVGAPPVLAQQAPSGARAGDRVRVKVVVCVPRDVPPPAAEQLSRFWRHVIWAQQHYRQSAGRSQTLRSGRAPSLRSSEHRQRSKPVVTRKRNLVRHVAAGSNRVLNPDP
jgi:hypothetical protein